ncbi:DUF6146 family protein [Chryseobacterium salipaludis]|uniref:DUF6146 family protein n=1 Tax=Chryseobacterium TaxID=59732 RepID=UPI000E928C62|nr:MULTISPECIES: DUF6146 family protein [Chryseobacterium]MCJ8497221.1 DUF6146 family protein [Chryseobacterium salipaludis]MCX3295628.1 DUF6146 family protein [Planobacterium sp. JC490]HAV02795.1 hypothetical protein [Chryseobacterium sp.]
MKYLIYSLLFLFSLSCTGPKAINKDKEQKIQAQKNEDDEYDLIVFDSQYDYFLNAVAKPMSMYSESYLKSKNRFLVSEWNSYYYSGRYRNIIESAIDYDPTIDYGLKFEYKLYQVFAYVGWKYGLRLQGISPADIR